ncbi:MAG TPA: glycosyltransferase family 4 protein [Ktedonobacterales bacterium]|jgi:glycosyltransferase involved in cell wall biosynthesis
MKTLEQLFPVGAAASPADVPASTQKRPPRTLLLIEADVDPELHAEIAADRFPRKDYFELARHLQADILDWSAIQESRVSRLLARYAGKSLAQAWLAFRQRERYDVLYSDSERLGIPLALLLKLARARTPHIMLTHYLSSPKKRFWFRWARIQSATRAILCHSTEQRRLLIEDLRVPEQKVVLLPYQADQHFWRPMTAEEARRSIPAPTGTVAGATSLAPAGGDTGGTPLISAPIICSVGLEFRDYPTLVEAVRGLDVQLEIAAASYWSDHSGMSAKDTLPPNVHVSAHKYLSLRHLYAASRFVVVPLYEVTNQAGITVILEGMAMGKAVIVSATVGQTDTIRDRRSNGYGRVERRILPGGFLDAPDVPDDLRRLPTGFYVKPGDASELCKAITYLLEHPDVADELGRNGRRVFEALMTLDHFAARIAEVCFSQTGR